MTDAAAPRDDQLRADVDERVRRARERLAALSDADLARPLADGWTVGLTLLHVGLGLRRQASWLERALDGRAPSRFRWETTHRLNAYVLRRCGRPARAQIADCLELGAARMRAALERVGPADLARDALLVDERRVSLGVVVSRIVLRHVDEHLAQVAGPVRSP